MMLHIALCDHLASELDQIHQLLDDWLMQKGLSARITSFHDGDSLLSHVEEYHNIDLVIMDIIMPGENGIEIGHKLRYLSRDILIVYLTASTDYALDAFDVHPLHYLLKPIVPARLYNTLNEAFSILQRRREDSIMIRTSSGQLRIVASDILFAELKGRKIHYHLYGGNVIESVSLRVSFAEAISELLNRPAFVLCGASYTVNLNHVQAIYQTDVILTGNTHLTLPKKAQNNLKAAWLKYWPGGHL